jgi:hypothetical protein
MPNGTLQSAAASALSTTSGNDALNASLSAFHPLQSKESIVRWLHGLDVVALCGLEWLYDKVEERHGTIAAWLITIALAAIILGAVIAVIIAIF